MLGLKIRDEIRWHDRWSSEIGRKLRVTDSTNDLYVFDEQHSREEVLAILHEAPEELYDLFEIREAPKDNCDFLADSGRCYSRK
ncbi:MAG: hypothetical protein WDA20_12610 [Desulfuromonadales bacterium]